MSMYLLDMPMWLGRCVLEVGEDVCACAVSGENEPG